MTALRTNIRIHRPCRKARDDKPKVSDEFPSFPACSGYCADAGWHRPAIFDGDPGAGFDLLLELFRMGGFGGGTGIWDHRFRHVVAGEKALINYRPVHK